MGQKTRDQAGPTDSEATPTELHLPLIKEL